MNLFLAIVNSIMFFLHADGLAEFQYSIDQQHVVLRLEMDQRELEHYQSKMNCSKKMLESLCFNDYLQRHSSFMINGKVVVFEFENSSNYNGHVILNLRSIKNYSEINEIEVLNNCFYEFNPAFKNRIRIEIDNYQKSYLLTKGKEKIKLNKIEV